MTSTQLTEMRDKLMWEYANEFTIPIQQTLGKNGYKAGFDAAHDLLMNDVRELVELIKSGRSWAISYGMLTYSKEAYKEAEAMHEALETFKAKYGE